MKVTVAQMADAMPEADWAALAGHVGVHSSQLVVLGEMPFAPWLAATDEVRPGAWQEAVEAHDAWMPRLSELGASAVVGSRPILRDGVPYNEAFVWSSDAGYSPTHLKYYLPDEPGFWEASWYRRAPQRSFQAAAVVGGTAGFMICTDMWFTEHARDYSRQGVDLLLVPRATEGRTSAKWLAGGRAAAVMAGAYCLSSNRHGLSHGVLFGGTAWIIDPDGNVLVTTNEQDPFATLDIDLSAADSAKSSYPRYIAE